MDNELRIVQNDLGRYRVQQRDEGCWRDLGDNCCIGGGAYFIAFETRWLWCAKLYRWSVKRDHAKTKRRNILADRWKEVK